MGADITISNMFPDKVDGTDLEIFMLRNIVLSKILIVLSS